MKLFTQLASLATVLTAFPAYAATIAYVDSDLTTHSKWRTASVTKALDADGNNVYGTDGYLMVSTPAFSVNPSYATVTRLTTTIYGGNTAYALVDNPTTGTTQVNSGIWYSSGSTAGELMSLAQINVTSAKSFRVGIFTDNADYADISPDALRIYQTAGSGAGDSGLQAAYLQPDKNGDWYFFDILNAQAGDVFTIAGTNGFHGTGNQTVNGIGGVTFDSIIVTVPEPTVPLYGALGLLSLLLRRQRRSPMHGA